MSPSYPPTAVLKDHLGFNDLPELADVLLTHKKFRMIIEGSSMYPALQAEDLVDVERIAEDRLQVGDLILFWKEHQLICHRLVGLSEEDDRVRVRAKGDAPGSEDAPLPVDQVLGRVCRIERKGRRFHPPGHAHAPRFWSFSLFVPFEAPSQVLENRSAFRLLAKVDGNVVGSLEVTAPDPEDLTRWSISHLFVRIPYRCCGIATDLLTTAFAFLVGKECLSWRQR